jgi:hypothetical protein
MKKLIYTAAALFITASGAMAQNLVQAGPGHQEVPGMSKQSPVKNNSNSALGKADISDWYDPADWLNAFTSGGTTLQTFVDFLMPDSLAQSRDEGDTIRRFYNIAAGQIIDPKDEVIERTDNPSIRMSKFSRYTLDSFYLTYLYVRGADTLDDGSKIVDTLIVSYLTTANLTRRTLTPTGTPAFSYALPAWDIATLNLTSVTAQEKFLLTDADSTLTASDNQGNPESSWRMKQMIQKVGPAVSIAAGDNNFVGLVFQFKPGMPYDENSIMYNQRATFPDGAKRVNYFGFRFNQNTAETNAQWRSTAYVNHSLFSYPNNAYYPSVTTQGAPGFNNGWTGFIPGNAYFEGRNIFSGVKVSAQGVGLKNSDLISISNVYPNPTKGATTVAFNLKQSANVAINVINIIGQTVASNDAGNFTAGNNTISLDLSGLKAGVYFVNITVDGATSTEKLTITE